MPISFLLDEHLRGILFDTIIRHNDSGGLPIDVTQVGDPEDLPLSSPDEEILVWAERNGYVLVSHDSKTMLGYFYEHLASGRHSPGLFLVKDTASFGQILAYLEAAAHAGDPADFADRVTFIP
jgi:hypothetical protein